MGPVDYDAYRQEEVLREEYELAAHFGRTSRGGVAPVAKPMKRPDGKKGFRYGQGFLPEKKTKFGKLVRKWLRWRPRAEPVVVEDSEWDRETAWLRNALGLEEDDMAKKVTTQDVFRVVAKSGTVGVTQAVVAAKLGIAKQLAGKALQELVLEGHAKTEIGCSGLKGGRRPKVFLSAVSAPAVDGPDGTVRDDEVDGVAAADWRGALRRSFSTLQRDVEELVEKAIESEVERRFEAVREALDKAAP